MVDAAAVARATGQRTVRYDGDQKLLAFAGAVSMVIGSIFWGLSGLRLLLDAAGPGAVAWQGLAAVACFAVTVAGLLFTLAAWGMRVKMERGVPLTRGELSRLLFAGFLVGVVLGFVVYLALKFKLEDPDFYHVASEPSNIPPALR